MRAVPLALFVLCVVGLLSGQSMKIQQSSYDSQLKTNIMIASSVTDPKLDYVLACLGGRADCQLLAAVQYSGFTAAAQPVYPSGPNLVTYRGGKR